jgi:hypothetical protein
MLRLLTPLETERFPFNNFVMAHGMLYTRRERYFRDYERPRADAGK